MKRPDRPNTAAGNKRIYYGWIMLTLLAVGQVTSWGILYYSFPVFLTPMRTELGWSTTALTGAYSVALLLSGFAAVPVGRWLDRHGPRAIMTAGSVSACLLVFAWAMVDSLWGFYLIWAGIGITMAAVLYEPAFQVVAVWFSRRRAAALTLLTFIGGFASVIYLPLANSLMTRLGWRDALVALALVQLAGTLPIHALALRRAPSDIGLGPDGDPLRHDAPAIARRRSAPAVSVALRSALFRWLATSFVLATTATMAITIHLIPYLVEQGYSASFAAGAAGLIGVFALPGRLIFTPLGSRVERRYVTALMFVLQTLALLVLIAASSRLAVLAFVVLFGAGFGAITPARAALVAELFGTEHYGSLNGVLALAITLSRAIAPVGAGVLAGWAGYTSTLWSLVALSAIAAIAALRLTPAGPQREDIERRVQQHA